MKTYIIHNSIIPESKRIANQAYQTFKAYKGWEPELYDGCYPSVLEKYDNKYGVKDGIKTKKYSTEKLTTSKKSCFYSHYTLWLKCIELNEPIAIVEHDVECIDDLNIPLAEMNGAFGIQLTTDSMLEHLKHYNNLKNKTELSINGKGIHKVFYTHPHGKKYFAGGTGYILSPEACKMIVEWCNENGWTQNDLLFDSDDFFMLYYIHPSPVKYFKSKELGTSSGNHIN